MAPSVPVVLLKPLSSIGSAEGSALSTRRQRGRISERQEHSARGVPDKDGRSRVLPPLRRHVGRLPPVGTEPPLPTPGLRTVLRQGFTLPLSERERELRALHSREGRTNSRGKVGGLLPKLPLHRVAQADAAAGAAVSGREARTASRASNSARALSPSATPPLLLGRLRGPQLEKLQQLQRPQLWSRRDSRRKEAVPTPFSSKSEEGDGQRPNEEQEQGEAADGEGDLGDLELERRFQRPLATFTRLRTKELSPLMDAEPAAARNGARLFAGRGLLARDVFEQYCSGPAPTEGPRFLGAMELGRLLRDNHVDLDYLGRCRALQLACGHAAQAADHAAFLRLVAATSTGTQPPSSRRRSPPREEAAVALVQAVFNSYDTDRSGLLERDECLELLADCGKAPRTAEQTKRVCELLSQCRRDGLPGALDFEEFQTLLRKVLNRV